MTIEQAQYIGSELASLEQGTFAVAFKQFLTAPLGTPKAWDVTREIENVLIAAGRSVSVRQRKASMLISWCTPKPATGNLRLRVCDPVARHRAINPR